MWTIARLLAILLGSHETKLEGIKEDGTPKNRWINDSAFNFERNITYYAQSSLIDMLKDHHSSTPHPDLHVTYNQVVGRKRIFLGV